MGADSRGGQTPSQGRAQSSAVARQTDRQREREKQGERGTEREGELSRRPRRRSIIHSRSLCACHILSTRAQARGAPPRGARAHARPAGRNVTSVDAHAAADKWRRVDATNARPLSDRRAAVQNSAVSCSITSRWETENRTLNQQPPKQMEIFGYVTGRP